MTTGERIKYFRKNKGLTQEQLANKLGVSVMTIRRFEADTREPKRKMLESIAEALEIPLSQLFDFNQPLEMLEQVTNEIQDSIQDSAQDLIEAGINVINEFYASNPKYIVHYWEKLNEAGKIEATRRVIEMTKLPEYTTPDED